MNTTDIPTHPAPAAPGSAAETGRQPAWLAVTIREIVVKATDRTFIISTVSTLVLVALGFLAAYFFSGRTHHLDVVVTDRQVVPVAEQAIAAAKAGDDRLTGDVTVADSEEQALQMLRDDDADVLVQRLAGRWTLTYKSEAKTEFESQFTQILLNQTITELAGRAGTTPAEVNAQMNFDTHLLEGDQQNSLTARIASLAFAALFMVSALTYGMQIATSIIEEKQSRIVEILVALIPVRQLLAGKVLGNTVIAVGQLVLLAGAGLIGLSLSPFKMLLPELSGGIGWFLVFFLAGFLALACIWAAAGALGTRSEDLQHTSQPLIWTLMLVYLAGFTVTGTVRDVLSYVPIMSSVLMPARIIEHSVSWWQPLIALILNLLFAFATVLLGERIYRNALLRTHGRLSYRQALKPND